MTLNKSKAKFSKLISLFYFGNFLSFLDDQCLLIDIGVIMLERKFRISCKVTIPLEKNSCQLMNIKYSFILERKRTQKRHRLEWIHRFPSCVFTLSSDKDQRNYLLHFRFHANVNEP